MKYFTFNKVLFFTFKQQLKNSHVLLHTITHYSMKKIFFLFFSLFLVVSSVLSQKKYTISGYVNDASNGEAMTGATVYAKENYKGTTANTYGFYSLTLDAGTYTFQVSFIGYETFIKTIELKSNISLNVELKLSSIETQAVIITGTRKNENIETTDMGKTEIRIETVKKMPMFFGEVDLIKTIQLLPGIQSSGEGNSGYYVRGGSLDQNLVLLDGATIYNVGHLFGFFSIFNTDAIRSAEMTKAGIPANFGGRLASVLDVSMKEGNIKKYEVDGGIGLIYSRINLQGPIVKNKASFLISGRRTYVDLIIQPFLKEDSDLKGMRFYFYDLNGKINWIINDKHHVFFSGYYGSDVYGFNYSSSSSSDLKFTFKWNNASAALRWNYMINSQLFLNTSILFSDYNFNTDVMLDIYNFNILSSIRDYTAKTELSYHPRPEHLFKFGANYIYHTFTPNTYSAISGDVGMNVQSPGIYYANEAAVYALDEFDIGKKLKFNVGIRASYFEHIGPYIGYELDELGRVIDSLFYKQGERIKGYWGVEPRFSVRFAIDTFTSLKASYTHNYQYIHQVALSTISLPTDAWIISNKLVKPQIGNQYSLGVYRNFLDNMIETSIEVYFKNMKNLTEYKEGYSPFTEITSGLEYQYTQGTGYGYGIELFLNKTKGKFTGWIGYTLSWAKRKFPEINGGKEFYAKNDRRHDISIMLSYEIVSNVNASLVWVYATGNTMTIPVGFYFLGYNLITEYSEKNAYRIAPYHRLDISVNWIIKRTPTFEHALNFSVYNVYNRRNPFFISINTQMNNETFSLNNTAYQMSLFPIMPSISWNFKFK